MVTLTPWNGQGQTRRGGDAFTPPAGGLEATSDRETGGLTGYLLAGGLTEDSWMRAGQELGRRRTQLGVTRSAQMWMVGDWLLAGEDRVLRNKKRSATRDAAARLTGYSKHTLTMSASVARKFDPSRRVDGLTWWHHLTVAGLEPDQQTHWLTNAAEGDWSVARLRDELRAAGRTRTDARSRRARAAVRGLTRLSRSEIPEPILAELRGWWLREMGGEGRGPA
jgi:hypothetical protein